MMGNEFTVVLFTASLEITYRFTDFHAFWPPEIARLFFSIRNTFVTLIKFTHIRIA